MADQSLLEKIKGRRVVASVSGGKDSAALSLWLTEQGIEHDRVFMDTGWEHPAVYQYVRGPLSAAVGPIAEVRSKKYPGGMKDLILGRGMFPSRLQRLCTQELKVFPIRDFIASIQDHGEEVLNAVGIRAEESEARSKMPEFEWSDATDCEVWRPILRWSMDDVIAIHQRHGLTPCPLYMGMMGSDGRTHFSERVGCFPCVMARRSEIQMVSKVLPERIEEIEALEEAVLPMAEARAAKSGTTLAEKGHTAPAFFQDKTGATGANWPIRKVVAWSMRGDQPELFDDPTRGCMRWGMCDTGSSLPPVSLCGNKGE
jgi:3'-phosphoadenosine 5'-phosphosulfate sulfotransferase (PAPS reductase)/FAD synthetase